MASPVLISAAAALIRVGVRRFRRPSCDACKYIVCATWIGLHTLSSLPHTQAAFSGASSRRGTSLRDGKVVESGSKGRVISTWLELMMDWIWLNRCRGEARTSDMDGALIAIVCTWLTHLGDILSSQTPRKIEHAGWMAGDAGDVHVRSCCASWDLRTEASGPVHKKT